MVFVVCFFFNLILCCVFNLVNWQHPYFAELKRSTLSLYEIVYIFVSSTSMDRTAVEQAVLNVVQYYL